MQVRDQQNVLRALVAGKGSPAAVFSEEDIAFLTPLLAEALTRAATDQQVGFRLVQAGAPAYQQRAGAGVGSSEPALALSPQEFTSGALFAYGRSLYFSLSEYRHRPEPADTINMPNRRLPDATGLVNRDIIFAPEAALRSDLPPPRFTGNPDMTLVIDYDLLARLPHSSGVTTAPAVQPHVSGDQSGTAPPPEVQPGELQVIKEEMKKKEGELQDLRRELDDIKRQLQQEPDLSVKPHAKPPARTPKESK